jgi:hypothetical protein
MTTSQSLITRTRAACGVPVGRELELMRRAEQPRLREVRPDELQSQGQPVDETARRRHAGQSREVRADGVDVVQIHGDRVVDLGADGEGRSRRRGPGEQIHLLECGAKIVRDQAAHALCLQIVRIEIAGRQHVGAGHDAALDLGAEPLAARALVEVGEILRALAAVAVAHAVEARQVRRALGRRDHVVSRHRHRQVRQAHFQGLGAERGENCERIADELRVARLEAVEEFAQQTDLQALERR